MMSNSDVAPPYFMGPRDNAETIVPAQRFPINLRPDDLPKLLHGKDVAGRGVSANRAMSILRKVAEPYGLYVGSTKRRASRERKRQQLLVLHIVINVAVVLGAAWAWWSNPRVVVTDRVLIEEPCQVMDLAGKASTSLRDTSYFVNVKCRGAVHRILHPVKPNLERSMLCDFAHANRATDDPPIFCRQD